MSATLYNTAILRLAAAIPLAGRLDRPQASVTRVSPVCGSKVTADVDLANGRVTRFAHDVRACALGQASAALLAARVIGQSPADLAAARDGLAAYLRGDAATPGDWPGLDVFDLARPHKARHGSILLAFQAAADAAAHAAAQPAVPLGVAAG
jgi:NifU-like protein involved in Fe-S cluster formation